MIRVFHGDDEFSIAQALRRVKESAGPPEVRDPNTTTFEGRSFKSGEVMAAASAVPFLADRRLVIINGLLTRLDARDRSLGADWDALSEGLQQIPATTEVVFVDRKPLRNNGRGLKAAGPRADVQQFNAPRGQALEAWVRDRFAHYGVAADRQAVARLAWLIGGQLRLLDQEIQKLSLYAPDRPVTVRDVDDMVSDAREESVFAAVDAVLERRPGVALRLMYSLLENGQTVISIILLLARQVRLVLLAGELGRAGVPANEIGQRIGLTNRYALEKTLRQSGRFPQAYLADVHRRLLAADLAIKTGDMEERLALEILVGGLAAA
ncbi:MAG: DNA polymerase III subunit delta [Dehalococcoidia bacterium]